MSTETITEYRGIDYLRKQLADKASNVNKRYDYYEMKQAVKDFMISSPPKLANWWVTLGWCGKAVDSVADRLVFRGFENDDFDMNYTFSLNNSETFFDSCILSSIISSCCFVYISKFDDGEVRLQVIDGGDATGIIDNTTGLLTEGYAVLERDAKGKPALEAHFMKGLTRFYKNDGSIIDVENVVEHPLLVPVIYRPDARRPFGRSRISTACMDIVGGAMRTVKRSEISSEFYSFPQKYMVGLTPHDPDDTDSEPIDRWRATLATMLVVDKDEDGDVPKVGQFTQQSMAPHLDHLKMFATLFATETGLTLDDLGFSSNNPATAESIKAAHENLRLITRKAQRTFNAGFKNVGYIAVCLRDNVNYNRWEVLQAKPKWEPVFEPDASALSSYGDGIIKINTAHPDYVDAEKMRDLLGW